MKKWLLNLWIDCMSCSSSIASCWQLLKNRYFKDLIIPLISRHIHACKICQYDVRPEFKLISHYNKNHNCMTMLLLQTCTNASTYYSLNILNRPQGSSCPKRVMVASHWSSLYESNTHSSSMWPPSPWPPVWGEN